MSTQGKKFRRKQFAFAGEWANDDPLAIGEENYSELENYRYRKRSGLEAVQGYTPINTTPLYQTTISCGGGTYCGETYCGAISTIPGFYYKGRSGIQLRSPHTQKTRVLIQALNTGENISAVLENLTGIPDQGDFNKSALHIDDSGAGLGRFAKWPGGHIAYCNGKESKIYAGDEKECDAFITSKAAIGDEVVRAIDYIDAVQNILDSAGNTVTLFKNTTAVIYCGAGTFCGETYCGAVGVSENIWLVGSTRRLQGVKYYIKTPNTTASTLSAKEFAGNGWQSLSIADNTASGGKSMAQTGAVTWPHTKDTSKVKFLEESLLYWYQFELSAGSTEVYHVTVDPGWQDICDLWDGLYRVAGQFRYQRSGAVIDATIDVNTETPAGADAAGSYATNVGGLTAGEWIDIGLEEQTCALYIKMFEGESGYVNTSLSTMFLFYWTGAMWQEVTGFVDGTSVSSAALAQSGYLVWTATEPTEEVRKNAYGTKLHYYRLKVNNPLSANVFIDIVQGVPAPNNLPKSYKFPFMFRGRPMLCANLGDKQGNRVDFGVAESTEGFNGTDSSFCLLPLYFGGSDSELVCSVELYNRFGANLYHMGIFCKDIETYLLTGDDADSYKIRKVSGTVGCPAALTMDVLEMNYALSEGVVRMVAGWLSYNGPYLFDAGVLEPITGNIKCYFDKSDPRCINFSAIERCRGWMDPDNLSYVLGLCSGVGQTEINVWVAYDLVLKRWYSIKPAGSNAYPQAAFRVVDENGAQYVYGLRDNGHMMRLENGPTWDGEAIAQKVVFADQVPTGNFWDVTNIRHFKLLCESVAENAEISIKHYADGEASATELRAVAASGSNRYVRDTQKFEKKGLSHKFELQTSTSSVKKGVPLLAWGYTFEVLSEDY